MTDFDFSCAKSEESHEKSKLISCTGCGERLMSEDFLEHCQFERNHSVYCLVCGAKFSWIKDWRNHFTDKENHKWSEIPYSQREVSEIIEEELEFIEKIREEEEKRLKSKGGGTVNLSKPDSSIEELLDGYVAKENQQQKGDGFYDVTGDSVNIGK